MNQVLVSLVQDCYFFFILSLVLLGNLLRFDKVVVSSFARKKIVMRALLYDLTKAHHDNVVSVLDSAESVSDHNGGTTLCRFV